MAAFAATVFLFDWDDTLLPTSALQRRPAPELAPALMELDALAEEALCRAMAIPGSQVAVLTNAEASWVRHSSACLPRLQRLLRDQRVPLVSAHRPFRQKGGESQEEFDRQLRQHELSSVDWKDSAVRMLARSLGECMKAQRPEALQVVTVGDREHDMEAGRTLGRLLQSDVARVCVKTVRMQERPSPAELCAELKTLCKMLPTLCANPASLSCSMVQQPLRRSNQLAAPGSELDSIGGLEAPTPRKIGAELLHEQTSETTAGETASELSSETDLDSNSDTEPDAKVGTCSDCPDLLNKTAAEALLALQM